MIPVTQTKVVVKNSKGDEVVRGNCFAASIASILELPIEQVPNVEVFFHMPDSSYWMEVMMTFLNSLGWDLVTDHDYCVFHPSHHSMVRIPENEDPDKYITQKMSELKDDYYLVSGPSVRGVNHITIYKAGAMVHDPHPTREGIKELHRFFSLQKSK